VRNKRKSLFCEGFFIESSCSFLALKFSIFQTFTSRHRYHAAFSIAVSPYQFIVCVFYACFTRFAAVAVAWNASFVLRPHGKPYFAVFCL
jgi:hypothetical protein